MYRNLVFRWHKKFQDSPTYPRRSRPGQPKTSVANANVTAVTGLIKQDIRLTVKDIAYSDTVLAYHRDQFVRF